VRISNLGAQALTGQSQTAEFDFGFVIAQVRQRARKLAVHPPVAGKKKTRPSFTGVALRALLVSSLMATGAMAGLSTLGRAPHAPDRILRATLPAFPGDREMAQHAGAASEDLAAVRVIDASAVGAREPEASGSGFMRLFNTIITAKPHDLSLSSDILKFGPMLIQQDLVSTIVRAANETQSDPALLMAIADKESSFMTGANAATSSATGLFQFVEGTWFKALREFGAGHGLAREASMIDTDLGVKERRRILDLRKDPYLAAVMTGEMLKKDKADIGERLGRSLTPEEIYLAHFLGPGDAYKFLAKVNSHPKTVAAKLLPKPARANRPIFFARTGRKSKSLTVAEVHRKLEQSMGLRLERYRNVSETVATAMAYRSSALGAL
jgi:hypothetical protein